MVTKFIDFIKVMHYISGDFTTLRRNTDFSETDAPELLQVTIKFSADGSKPNLQHMSQLCNTCLVQL